MLGFIGNLAPLEILVIVALAVVVFGRRLPQVAGRLLYQLRRLRQSMYDLRRESGIDREIRNVERTVRQAAWAAEARAAEEVKDEKVEQESLPKAAEPDEPGSD